MGLLYRGAILIFSKTTFCRRWEKKKCIAPQGLRSLRKSLKKVHLSTAALVKAPSSSIQERSTYLAPQNIFLSRKSHSTEGVSPF